MICSSEKKKNVKCRLVSREARVDTPGVTPMLKHLYYFLNISYEGD